MSFPLPPGQSFRFTPPPNWPAPPPGWTRPPGWVPDPSWPPPPQGWQLWIEDPSAQQGLRAWDGARADVTVPPPGWYLDAHDSTLVRWWDGTQWTVHTAAVTPVPNPPASGAPGPSARADGRQAQAPWRRQDLQAEAGDQWHRGAGPGLREQEELRAETVRLREELPQLKAQHDKLRAAVSSLREEVERLTEQRLHMLTVQS